MEGPISFRGYKEQESTLILPEHDDYFLCAAWGWFAEKLNLAAG